MIVVINILCDDVVCCIVIGVYDCLILVEVGVGFGKMVVMVGCIVVMFVEGIVFKLIVVVIFMELVVSELLICVCDFVVDFVVGIILIELCIVFFDGLSVNYSVNFVVIVLVIDEIICLIIYGFCQWLIKFYLVEVDIDFGVSVMDCN